mmetsp:Transcript_20340/g.27501  ORF Transcript_20340/g.27501 Transcript_20340/m.27501 type:complete len:80 (+) Transcript_20340:150-389(+)
MASSMTGLSQATENSKQKERAHDDAHTAFATAEKSELVGTASKQGGASGFYTTREADEEYKIQGIQDEDSSARGQQAYN